MINYTKKFQTIETERLLLREITLDDSIEVFNIFSDEDVTKYYGIYPLENIDEAESLINVFRKNFKENKSIRWGIELKDEKILIGTCGYHNMNQVHSRSEIGYELNKNYWKRGYITEAIGEIIKYGFNKLNLHRVEAVIYPENIASENSLKKLGFEKEGIVREYAFFRGKYQNLAMYSLLNNL